MSSINEIHWQRISTNLFPAAHPAVQPWRSFPWHSSGSGSFDTWKVHSSQALALDFFGTLKTSPDRDAVLNAVAERVSLPTGGPWQLHLEWCDPRKLLGEPRPTQVDALAVGRNAVIAFECKFTERDGGGCSQTKPLYGGSHAGMIQCNGRYELQTNPVTGTRALCALTNKGIEYWRIIPKVYSEAWLARSEKSDALCPFAGGRYQWMRNLVLAWKTGDAEGKWPGFVLVYAQGRGLPMSQKVEAGWWQREVNAEIRQDEIAVGALAIQQLVELARNTSAESDKWAALGEWIEGKVSRVHR